jgi:undecaprenyl-diphosphatase
MTASVLVPLVAVATFALWLLARPYASTRWKMATASALAAAAVAMLADQVIGHLWARPRPFVAHAGAVDLLTAPNPDPSFPSDHAAVAFAIAVAVLVVSRKLRATCSPARSSELPPRGS